MDGQHRLPEETVAPERGCLIAEKRINLALQGGGAHGAFTWGVLDRLLEDERIAFEAVSATSAGAMNAVVLAYGLTEGGRQGGQRALAAFWRRVSHAGAFSPLQPSLLDRWSGNRALENSPAFMMFDIVSRLLSPYQFNPLNWNPLRQVLEQSVDFAALRRASCKLRVHLSATNVRSGKIKVFGNDELSSDAVMASACLPFLFQAVEIDGEAYWDGGYSGNPALFPLIYDSQSSDVLIVHINPLCRDSLPTTASEILNRINEISFNSSLLRELRAVAFVTRLIQQDPDRHLDLKEMKIHAIADDEAMGALGVASKLNADWEFLTFLRDRGRAAAETWLGANYDALGRRSSIDLKSTYA